MTVFYLIRHGAHELLGKVLVGRGTIALSARGRAQAEVLAERLATTRLRAVWSSPRQRALETAAPIARRQALEPRIAPALDEVDFGDWTGRSFAELEADPRWGCFNRWRGTAEIPGGERALAVQERVVGLVGSLHAQYAGGEVALVSHGDVLRAILLHYLGIPLDFYHRLEVSPGRFSILSLSDEGPRVLAVNAVAEERV